MVCNGLLTDSVIIRHRLNTPVNGYTIQPVKPVSQPVVWCKVGIKPTPNDDGISKQAVTHHRRRRQIQLAPFVVLPKQSRAGRATGSHEEQVYRLHIVDVDAT